MSKQNKQSSRKKPGELTEIAAPPVDHVAIQVRNQPYLEACARASARCAGMLSNIFQLRLSAADAVGVVTAAVKRSMKMASERGFVPETEMFEIPDAAYRLASCSTDIARNCLNIFKAQVTSFNLSYESIRELSAIAAFNALREVSRALNTDFSPEMAALWKYVLGAWEKVNSKAVRVARWEARVDEIDPTHDEAKEWDMLIREGKSP